MAGEPSGPPALALADRKRKSPEKQKKPDVCDNWNNRRGKCAADGGTCAANRIHKCKVCGSANHRSVDHRESTRWGGDKHKDQDKKKSKKGKKWD